MERGERELWGQGHATMVRCSSQIDPGHSRSFQVSIVDISNVVMHVVVPSHFGFQT